MTLESRTPAAVVLAAGTNGLGAVRSLWLKGIPVMVVCWSRDDPAFLSRLPSRKTIIPEGEDLPSWLHGYFQSVAGVANCVIPTSDEFAAALRKLTSSSVECLPCILPADDLVNTLNDKKLEVALIKNTGAVVPDTVLDLHTLGSEASRPRFPIIVKPRTYRDLREFGAKNLVAQTQSDLDGFLQEQSAKLDRFIAQEVIPGDEQCLWMCNATFDKDSRMVSAFSYQKLGTKPFLYGVTTFAVSRHNPEVKAMCARIGRALNYRGPGGFEFKRDPRSGQYYYIEVNPRLGMCNWFDTRCGVNNVFNTYALIVGISPDENVAQQTDGIHYFDLAYDLSARIVGKQRARDIIRHYATHIPSRVVFPAWHWRDPVPALSLPLRMLSRGRRRPGSA